MEILLLGTSGQLGWELHRTLAPLGELMAMDFPQIDLRQADTLRKMILEIRPQVIVNAAAYTAVDRAEQEPEIAMAINAHASGVLAESAKSIGAALLHYSTDYVFDGEKRTVYIESDAPNPLNVYGKSKLLGEQAITQINTAYFILRTSWLYSLRRECFVTRIMRMARQNETLHIVTDQVGSPTWSRMLAEITALLLAMSSASQDFIGWLRERRGIYHLAGEGSASRYEWAEAILNFLQQDHSILTPPIYPSTTAEFPTPAQRPLFSALDCNLFKETFGLQLPAWKDTLRQAIESGES